MRSLVSAVAALAAASCAVAQSPNVGPDYFAVSERNGAASGCATPFAKHINLAPNLGGDLVVAGRDVETLIFDIGDNKDGPTIDRHDRLVFRHAPPQEFVLERRSHSLALCAPDQRYAVLILRQYCSGEFEGEPWNNAIEQITFASGETWLADALFDQIEPGVPFMTRQRLKDLQIKDVTDAEVANWRVFPYSRKLPAAGSAAKRCAEDTRDLAARGRNPAKTR